MRDKEYSLEDSAVESISARTIGLQILSLIVFGGILAMRTAVSNLDKVGGGNQNILIKIFLGLLALSKASYEGMGVALSAVWTFIQAPSAYFNSGSWGSIIFSIVMIISLLIVIYQPVSFLINLFDMQRGQATLMIFRIMVTLIIVLLLAWAVGSFSTAEPIILQLGTNNSMINSTIQNTTNIISNTSTNGGSVISLL